MSTSDLKLKLIAQIIATDDSILLGRIEETIESNLQPTSAYEKKASEKIYVFNQWQQKRIDMALKQVENGEFLTEAEDKKEMERWFKEKDEKLIRK
ncbi:hypothetical protein [Flavobacterium sp. A45]|uniref:hypothetical protein n=1 Tax=Flavobacterium sp. A45 TaxID=1945862 RepID=UPI000986928E|nr:hypothetical protein [Flavobacterium sp. A45]OOG65815.1 hypothetical protein B0E44_15455 [Flavobacterium sp. A45]